MAESERTETSGKTARPAWLVGAEADPALESALETASETARVVEPKDGGRVARGTSEPAAEAPRPAPTTWTAAASSIPHLKVVPEGAPAAAHLPSVPEEPDAVEDVFPADAVEASAVPERPSEAPGLKPLHEPLWVVWSDALAADRRLQLGIAVGLVIALVLIFAPRGRQSGTSIGEIKRHPEAYEGRVVSVRGRVGEVFAVGQGYVFDLHQGGDTMVVFTHTRAPEIHDKINVKGQVSTGFLDGRARVALFEGDNAASGAKPGN